MLRNYIKRMQDAVSDYANNRVCGNEIDACVEVWNISIDALGDMIRDTCTKSGMVRSRSVPR